MNDANKDHKIKKEIGADLSDVDRDVLQLWRENSSLLDVRYHSTSLLGMVERAMTDDGFRSRLVEDTDTSLDDLKPNLPEWKVRFLDNSPTMLNVVLPPRAGEMAKRPAALRDALRSRTADALVLFKDEWDLSDAHKKDSIFLPDEP